MDIIRLGDRLEGASKSVPRNTRFINDEFLAQKVFDPVPDSDDILSWFISSQPYDETNAFRDALPEGTPALGQYEVKLLDKIINPQRPVLVIVGGMGSGKTTVKNYTAMNLTKNRAHCGACNHAVDRLIADINFNDHAYLNDLTGVALSNKFYSILCTEMYNRIGYNDHLDEQHELGNFWDYELGRYANHKSSSPAFQKIFYKIRYHPREEGQPLTSAEISERKKVRKSIEKNLEIYLDYLIRFWAYIIKNQFCGNNGCAYIILDNLDHIDPSVQRKILKIIHMHANPKGPTFILLLRPETFDYMGLGTGIIDIEDHHSPKVLDVIKNRLDIFCKEPDQFYQEGRGLSSSQYEIIKTFMGRVCKEIQVDKHQNFRNFIENSCGNSIRNGLVIMQGLFSASLAEMVNPNLSNRDVIRMCIRKGDDQLRWNPNHQINHLFRIANRSSESMLIKPRILRYLGRHAKGKRRLNEITNTLLGFGYEDELTLEAINDLMQISSQLVRSNGFNHYEEDALRKYPGNTIMLTGIGRGYSNYLLSNIDYLQEVMLDTYVDGNNFPKDIGFGYLVDKFKLLYLFLNEMRRIDVEETESFVERFSEKAFIDAFGDHLITLDIIQAVFQPAVGILDTEKHDRYEVEQLIGYFRSLTLNVEADNHRILDVATNSVVPSNAKK